MGAHNCGPLRTGIEKVRDFEEQRSLNLRAYLAEWSEEDALEAGQVLEKLTTSLNHSVRATAAGSHHSNHTA